MELEREKKQGTGNQKTKPKTRSQSLGGVVTDRDKIACQWVCEQGVMTVEQLWRAVWWSPESNSPRYAYDRVAWLVRAGFLQGLRTPHSLKTYFKATKAAQELAGQVGDGQSLIPLHAPPTDEILHADGMTELRLAVLKTGKMSSWKTDRVLLIDPKFPRERFYKHVHDAIWVTASGKKIAVEYERTRKSVSRLRLKIETFSREIARSDREFDQVLWIASPGTMSTLTTVLGSHPNQHLRSMTQFLSELKTKTSPDKRGEE